MATCHTCSNDYEESFRITMHGKSYDFDSFECAIHALAPTCEHCSCRILGHGVQSNEMLFCCANCAAAAGCAGLVDHTEAA